MALTKWCKFGIDLRANNKMSPFVFSVTALPRLANTFCWQSFLNCTVVNYSLNKVNLCRIVRDVERELKISIYSLISTASNSSWDEHIPPEGPDSRLSLSAISNLLVCCETRRDNQTKTRILIVWNVSFCIGIFWTGQVSFSGINRELKHDVYGRR